MYDTKAASHIDKSVGAKIKLGRLMAGLSREKLGVQLGISWQQIQKYETGMNRVSASRLWDIARAVDVPVSFFFEGLHEGALADEVTGDILADKEALQLVRAYYAMPAAQRRQIFELARVLSDAA